jgi:hypothetical protein
VSLFAPKDVRQRRAAICRACPLVLVLGKRRQWLQCSRCGCLVSMKTLPLDEKCPEGKW